MRKQVLAGVLSMAMAASAMSMAGCTPKEEKKETTKATTEAAKETEKEKATEEKKTENVTEKETEVVTEKETEKVTEEEAKETETAGEPDLLAQILERGSIIIATEGTYAPWCYHDEETDALIGYDIEVATHIAEKLGVEAEFVEVPWDGIFAGLDAGRYDIVANEVEINETRLEKYDFSEPYAYIYTALIVAEDNEDIKSFEDLDGKKTANTLSSTYASLAESYGAVVTGIDTLDETIELLISGRVDATLNADVSFYDYVKVHEDAPIKIAAFTEEPVVASIPVRKGEESASLLVEIDKALAELAEEGVLSELSVKYFGEDISTSEGK